MEVITRDQAELRAMRAGREEEQDERIPRSIGDFGIGKYPPPGHPEVREVSWLS